MLHTRQEPIFMSVTYNAGSDTFLHPNQNYLDTSSHHIVIYNFRYGRNWYFPQPYKYQQWWTFKYSYLLNFKLTVTHVRLMNSIRLYQLYILTSITEIIPKLCYTKNITIKKKLTLVKTSISKLMPMFLIKHSYK